MADKLLHGIFPYRDYPVEYPPLILVSIILPGLCPAGFHSFTWLLAAEMLIFDIIIILYLKRAARELDISERRVLVLYSIGLAAVGPIVVYRHDLLPAALTIISLTLFLRGKHIPAWALLGLATATKIYPAVLAPLFLISQLINRRDIELLKGLTAFGGVIVVVFLPIFIIDREALWYIFSFHLERGLHIESSGGVLLMFEQMLGLTSLNAGLSYGSWNLISPTANVFATLSLPVTAVLLLIGYITYLLRLRRQAQFNNGREDDTSGQLLVLFASFSITIFVIGGKVFSPQYLIWLLPMAALTPANLKLPFVCFCLAAVLTQINFPYTYMAFVRGESHAVMMMVLRNIALIAMALGLIIPAVRGMTEQPKYSTMQ